VQSTVLVIVKCPSVRPSVSPSHSCIRTAKDIVRPLAWPNSPIILVFEPSLCRLHYKISRGTPTCVGIKITQGLEKFTIYGQYFAICWKWC